MGVDLFFVLSGFLIGMQVFSQIAQTGKLSFGDFYIRRAFRILPAYLTVLLAYLFWPTLRETAGMEPWWKFLTFTMNLSIDYASNSAFSHAWSLCVEEHFYWLFPILAVALLRRRATWKFAFLCVGLVGGGIVLRAVIWIHGMEADPTLIRNWFIEDIYYPTWNRLDGLLCGVVLAAWKVFRPQAWLIARRYASLSFYAGILVMALSFWLFRERTGLLGNTIGWPVLAFGLGLLVFAAADRDNFFGNRDIPMASWLAAISYSLYLVHKATYHLVQVQWGSLLAESGFLAFLVYGSTAIFAGAALHYAIERPFLKMRLILAAKRRSDVAHNTV
jgi:peptidoglycan/LPS O-acetylase OafA/YrhL